MNIWHDIRADRIRPERFMVVIEIAAGSKKKYELDKETGYIVLDRILYTSTQYPANYGFIPRTYSEDNDPLDVLVLCQEKLDPLVLVECLPIGAIIMIDEEEVDEKIVAVPINDPSFNTYEDIHELPPHIMDEFSHFLDRKSTRLNSSHQTSVRKVLGREESISIVKRSMERYNEIYK